MAKMDVSLEVMEDGVYLVISRASQIEKVDIQFIMDKIDEFDVKDIFPDAITKIVDSEDIIIREKVSNNVECRSVDEGVTVKIIDNNMKAVMEFSRPVNGGNVFTRDDIMKILHEANVRAGVDETEIDDLVEHRQYGYEYQIAFGEEPVEGQDGYVKFHFDTNKKSLQPKLLDDGTVDYYNLNLFQQIKAGEVLAERVDPIAGTDGFDVRGNKIQAKIGKVAGNLPTGKNVQVTGDNKYTIATTSGQIEYKGGKININEVLTLKKVDASTGNIDYNGAVVIEGNVFSGFSVVAKGSVEVHGICEAAHIESQGDILLYSGVMGHEKAEIIAEGNITAKFIDSSTVSAGGTIQSNSIMHSNVECVKTLTLAGKNGLLVGGTICVGEKIEAVSIGSPMATLTVLEVGSTPARLAGFRALEENLEETVEQIHKTDQMINVLKSQATQLSPEKKNLLLKSYHVKIHLIEKKTKIEQQIAELLPTLQNDKGIIIASKIMYSGCKVQIGGSRMQITDDILAARLTKNDQKIEVGINISN